MYLKYTLILGGGRGVGDEEERTRRRGRR